MSTHFDLYCVTCEVFGPEIRRSPSGTALAVRTQEGFWTGNVASVAWGTFLVEHEYHELELRREGTRPRG